MIWKIPSGFKHSRVHQKIVLLLRFSYMKYFSLIVLLFNLYVIFNSWSSSYLYFMSSLLAACCRILRTDLNTSVSRLLIFFIHYWKCIRKDLQICSTQPKQSKFSIHNADKKFWNWPCTTETTQTTYFNQ